MAHYARCGSCLSDRHTVCNFSADQNHLRRGFRVSEIFDLPLILWGANSVRMRSAVEVIHLFVRRISAVSAAEDGFSSFTLRGASVVPTCSALRMLVKGATQPVCLVSHAC